MFLPFFLIFGSCRELNSAEMILCVTSVVCTCLVIVIVVSICCLKNNKCCCGKQNDGHADKDGLKKVQSVDNGSPLTKNLIPPLFFTQGIKDPLLQDDLIDNVNKLERETRKKD